MYYDNTHDTCKKHLAYRLCLYVGPSIAIAMGLTKIIRHVSGAFLPFVNLSSVVVYSHIMELIVGFNLLSYFVNHNTILIYLHIMDLLVGFNL